MNTATTLTQPTLGMWIPEVNPSERERNVYIRRFGCVSETAERYNDSNLLTHPEAVADACRKVLNLDSYSCEVFMVLALDKKCRLNGASIVTQGTLDASLVHPREVFQAALMHNAASVIVAHNHPSGDPSPSTEDINVTRKLIEAGRILSIPLTDHIIIGDSKLYPTGGGFHSVRRSGVLAFE